MNSLNQSKVNNQLFYFAKESLKQIVLFSKCGITLKGSSLEKTLPNNDINIVKNISPLLCIYKKADSKISLKNKNFTFKYTTKFLFYMFFISLMNKYNRLLLNYFVDNDF